MTQKDREREVRRRLYQYASSRAEVETYEGDIIFGVPVFDESGVRGSGTGDPTARKGIALAEIPDDIIMKARWIDCINESLLEMKEEDADLVTIAVRIFGLDGRRHKRRANRELRFKVANEMNLSTSALYYKQTLITRIVMFHAAARGLLK